MPFEFRFCVKPLVSRLAETRFVRSALEDEADLSAFRKPPSLKVIAGVSAILLSYLIGWPLIGLLGAVAVYHEQPMIVAVGGPLAYGLSHLVFLLGMVLAGAQYSRIFLRWAARTLVLKFLKPSL
ncbi:MAG: hypothetical protein ACOWWM_06570 [Desulfobacterales bacterium]